jgi:molybdate transport system substrate-binding protein
MPKLGVFAVGLLIATGATVSAAEINLFSANGARLMVNALVPEFERTTKNRVITKFEEPRILRKSILDGEDFDLIILPAGWDEVRAKIAGNPVGVARTDFGILVRADAPKPDTSSNEAVKRTLLAVKSIVYTDPKTGAINGVLFARMIERLGIADEVNKKSKIVLGPPMEFLAKGEADLAVALAIGVVDFPGMQFAPMPPEFRASVTFSGAIATGTKEPAAAKALLQFLTSPAAAPAIRSKGYEPG